MVKDMKSSGYFVIGIIFLIILFIVVSFKFNVYKITFVVDNEIYKTTEVRKDTALKEVPVPTKEGYAFIGWYDQNGNFYENGTTITDDIIYYARWATIVTDENEN